MASSKQPDKQPEVNIGMVGHVDHGKTTLTKALSGQWTDRHSEEIKRGISIKLGYADTTFYKCPKCEEPACYGVKKECTACGSKAERIRSVSFVDAPGHETLMATMLSGAAIMDGALLLIAANEKCPQPQTKEHLMALQISGVKKVIIVQNKIDLVDQEALVENYEQIKEFVAGTIAGNAPIIPISAHHDVNIDALIQAIEDVIPTPAHDSSLDLRMYIARSFDVNKPGMPADDLVGGILGGSITQGVLKKGQIVEIAPGNKAVKGGKATWENITTQAVSVFCGSRSMKEAAPGGLIGIGTELDPLQTKSDSLIGRVLGKPGTLPPIWDNLMLETNLLERVVGTSEDVEVEDLKSNEPLMLNIGTTTTVGIIRSATESGIDVGLKLPVSAEVGQRVAISRRISGKWRLIGYGIIQG